VFQDIASLPHAADTDDEHPEAKLRRIAVPLALIEAQRAELQRTLAEEQHHGALFLELAAGR
jgi:hypothetical protein